MQLDNLTVDAPLDESHHVMMRFELCVVIIFL